MTRDSEGRPQKAKGIDALIAASQKAREIGRKIANAAQRHDPSSDNRWSRRQRGYHGGRKPLINPVAPATVIASVQRGGNFNIVRDGVLTHIIIRTRSGRWLVSRFKGSGISNVYGSPQEAARGYKLLVHQWKGA
jgi:hypothetical protein